MPAIIPQTTQVAKLTIPFIEQNVIELDPVPNGQKTDDVIIDVRTDRVGVLDVGPMILDKSLSGEDQLVEVEMVALGTRADGTDRSEQVTRFRWKAADQGENRYWKIYTGQKDFAPRYKYQVHVTIRGSLFSDGMAWSGPWQDDIGNGPLIIHVPKPTDQDVTRRDLTAREIVGRAVVRAASDMSTGTTGTVAAPTTTTSSQPSPAPVGALRSAPGASIDAEERTVDGYILVPNGADGRPHR